MENIEIRAEEGTKLDDNILTDDELTKRFGKVDEKESVTIRDNVIKKLKTSCACSGKLSYFLTIFQCI